LSRRSTSFSPLVRWNSEASMPPYLGIAVVERGAREPVRPAGLLRGVHDGAPGGRVPPDRHDLRLPERAFFDVMTSGFLLCPSVQLPLPVRQAYAPTEARCKETYRTNVINA
jgi:hypothetical protein